MTGHLTLWKSTFASQPEPWVKALFLEQLKPPSGAKPSEYIDRSTVEQFGCPSYRESQSSLSVSMATSPMRRSCGVPAAASTPMSEP